MQSSFANAEGGLGALSLVDSAKEAFETALAIDATALNGSAHSSIGILFLKVPGWPISFGDEDDAEKHLKKALKINPTGLDVNFFLAQYYLEQNELKTAKKYLLIAKAAPVRANRPMADQYRQEEVSQLLANINKKLK